MKHFVSTQQDSQFETFDHTSSRNSDVSRKSSASSYGQFGKRVLDIFFVLNSLIIVVPIVLICAVLVVLDGGAPFFGHKRVGRNGREFRCWKIRSMVVDSQARLKAHLAADPAARLEWETTRKLTNDPRITRVGRFLRKSSLDELPQLLNVFLGQMSIVGPRPVPRDELALYGTSKQAYLDMRPGITGLWQVSGRNSVSYATRIEMDQEYRRTSSLKLDLMIIFKTFAVVLKRSGH